MPRRGGVLDPRAVVVAIATSVLSIRCGGSAVPDDPGIGSTMRVAGAQFILGAMPDASPGAPDVDSIDVDTTTIWPGEIDKAVAAALDPSATAVALALVGDDGYWIVPAGVPDFATPTLPSLHATASFAATLAPGSYALELRAVDTNGAFGPPSTQTLTAVAQDPADPTPEGALVVSVTWDTEADVDLHVVDPLGNEIYHGDMETLLADGGVSGQLDVDSNANCVIDGRRQEDVTWASSPPSGQYLVRVDTASLCGQPNAHWAARATLDGAPVGAASGESLDSDTQGPHDRGAGLLVLQFDVP